MASDQDTKSIENESVSTWFAPAERAGAAEVKEMSQFVRENPLFLAILESIDGYLMILNHERQVLAMNQQLLKDLKIEDPNCLAGDRPGEILGCIHAHTGPGGCGTSKTCATCGAVISIMASQTEGEPITNECLATVRHGDAEESLEFRVRATPIRAGSHEFTVLTFHDISGDKRRQALERTFFHDILNTVGGLMGWSSLMQTIEGLDPKETAQRILVLSRRLKQEIEEQRRLLEAENGTLSTEKKPVHVREILEGIGAVFEGHTAAKDRHVEIAEIDELEEIQTDPGLLQRILTNMTKNALEAIPEGETVRVAFERRDGRPVFLVSNPGMIPEQVQLQLFKRSFSTKAAKGRGIGTYSMKLFGERYLGGLVAFESTAEKGTTFRIELPAGDESTT
ncbi:HAMP domain-containing histidine kinase [bacterium]|nr:HAMP domain-containing histidine kinase [bacterium]